MARRTSLPDNALEDCRLKSFELVVYVDSSSSLPPHGCITWTTVLFCFLYARPCSSWLGFELAAREIALVLHFVLVDIRIQYSAGLNNVLAFLSHR